VGAAALAHQALGRAAERAAREFLAAQGLSCVAANFRTRAGELDLVMREGPLLVVVEVRCRRCAARYGGAAASVDRRKQRRLIAATGLFLLAHRRLAALRIRFDVVAVTPGAGTLLCEWLRDAFRA
jgi:putative endonuclease